MSATIQRYRKGQHLKQTQRLLIEHLRLQGHSTRDIADVVGCSHVTVCNELKRGQYEHTNSDLTTEIRYSPEIAEKRYQTNLAAKGAQVKIGHDHKLAKALETLVIKKNYSPSAAVAELNNKGWNFDVKICARTVYNYIDTGVLNINRIDLPMKGRQKRKYRRIKTQKRVSAGTSIDYRPEEVDERTTLGHWEMDTVYTTTKKAKAVRLKPALLVLTERLSRKELIIKMRDRTSASVVRALNRLERSMGAKKFTDTFRTITVDNGSEFANVDGMENSGLRKSEKRTKVYYCHAHHSWERGSNENANRLIRRWFPKGTDFSKVTAAQIAALQDWINNYPRKVLSWATSNTVYELYMQQQE